MFAVFQVHDALDLYYAVGEYQRSLHLGKVIRNESEYQRRF